MLGAWAEATERVEIGALVTCNTYRNPELLADMARTVDHISDGRLILGIGSGWFEQDYDEYGYEFGTAGGRLDALAETCRGSRARWAGSTRRRPAHIPVLIGGGGERKTLRIVAQHADIWHGFGDADDDRPQAPRCSTTGAPRSGRDPPEIERSAGVAGRRTRTCQSAESLYAVGTRLFTVGRRRPATTTSAPLRDLVAWRDETNKAEGAA